MNHEEYESLKKEINEANYNGDYNKVKKLKKKIIKGNKKMPEVKNMLDAAKENLSSDQKEMLDQEYEKRSKSMLATYLLWFLFGVVGIHKFYVRKTGMGVLYIFTGGLFGIGLLIDIFLIPSQVREVNDIVTKEIILEIKALTKENQLN